MKWNNLLLTTTVTKTVDRQVHHQTNIFTSFIQSINWNKIIGHAIVLVASLILLTLFFLIVNSVGKRVLSTPLVVPVRLKNRLLRKRTPKRRLNACEHRGD